MTATSSSREELNLFITSVNPFHPALDIKLSINDNGLSTSVNYKPTNSHNYLLHSSSHPQHVKNAIPFSQFLRLWRLYSDESDFDNKCEKMCQFFKNAATLTPLQPQANIAPKKSTEIPHYKLHRAKKPTEFHSLLPTIHKTLQWKNVILKNFKVLRNDPKTKHIFTLSPLISFKRDKNLRYLLS